MNEQQKPMTIEVTIRDLIAVVAMAVELSHDRGKEFPDIAESAYMMADSMIEERARVD